MSARGEPSATQVDAAALLALGALVRQGGSAALAERPGTAPAPRRGQGHAIREIRPFAEGDDPRHIDPAATARSGALQVRGFHEDHERTVLLVADFRYPMLWGTRGRLRSVAAAEALARIGWQAVHAGGAAGVVTLTEVGLLAERPRPRDRGMAWVCGTLARGHALALSIPRPAPNRPLAPDLARAARFAPRGATIVLATGLDLPGPEFEATLAGLARRGPARLLLIEDAFETTPPAAALPFLDAAGRPARGRFDALPAARAERARALRHPGISIERIASGDLDRLAPLPGSLP